MSYELTSTKNPLVRDARRLHATKERRLSGRILVEGPTLIAEAIAADLDFLRVFVLMGEQDHLDLVVELETEIVGVAEHVMSHIGSTSTPRGPIAIVRQPETSEALGGNDCLVLGGVSDPGNAGTMVRTAVALGFDIAVLAGTVDLWSPKVLRAGAGALFAKVPHVVESLDELASLGLRTIGLVVDDGGDLEYLDAPGHIAIVVGNEARGLSDDVSAQCQATVTLPMPGGFESLNAATAAAIAIWERSRRRST
jgi:RNA methyltransferase, TrmH family